MPWRAPAAAGTGRRFGNDVYYDAYGGSTADRQDVDSQAWLTYNVFPSNTGYRPSASSDAEVSNHKPDNYSIFMHCFGFSIILLL